MGQLDSTCTAPRLDRGERCADRQRRRAVALQVAFENANFETRFPLHRLQGLKPGAFKLRVIWIQLVQPHRVIRGRLLARERQPVLGVESLHRAVAARVAF